MQATKLRWIQTEALDGVAVSIFRFCYHLAMTIGITGPRRQAPWRGAVVVLIIAGIVLSICLILLGLTGDFLVDWLWFSTIGYLGVFWTTIAAEGEIFFAVFVATAIILWVNGSIASRIARSPWTQRPADFEWQRTGVATLPDVLEFLRLRLPSRRSHRRRQPPRRARRLGRGPQLGRLPAVPLSGAVWRKRPPLR